MIITLIAVVVVVGIYTTVTKLRGDFEAHEAGGAAVLSFIIATFVTVFLSYIVNNSNEIITSEVELVSLERSGAVATGDFFLGCGIVEGKTSYFYFTKESSHTFLPSSVLAGKTKIIEDGGCKLVIRRSRGCVGSWWWWLKHGHYSITRCYEFHIPKGSVKPMFKP